MLITTGKVNDGMIQVDTKVWPDGTSVTVLAHDGDETFELNAALMNTPLPVRIVRSAARAIVEAADWRVKALDPNAVPTCRPARLTQFMPCLPVGVRF